MTSSSVSDGGGDIEKNRATTASLHSADSRSQPPNTNAKGKKQAASRFYVLLEELAQEHERAVTLVSGKLEIARGALDKLRNEASDGNFDVVALSSLEDPECSSDSDDSENGRKIIHANTHSPHKRASKGNTNYRRASNNTIKELNNLIAKAKEHERDMQKIMMEDSGSPAPPRPSLAVGSSSGTPSGSSSMGARDKHFGSLGAFAGVIPSAISPKKKFQLKLPHIKNPLASQKDRKVVPSSSGSSFEDIASEEHHIECERREEHTPPKIPSGGAWQLDDMDNLQPNSGLVTPSDSQTKSELGASAHGDKEVVCSLTDTEDFTRAHSNPSDIVSTGREDFEPGHDLGHADKADDANDPRDDISTVSPLGDELEAPASRRESHGSIRDLHESQEGFRKTQSDNTIGGSNVDQNGYEKACSNSSKRSSGGREEDNVERHEEGLNPNEINGPTVSASCPPPNGKGLARQRTLPRLVGLKEKERGVSILKKAPTFVEDNEHQSAALKDRYANIASRKVSWSHLGDGNDEYEENKRAKFQVMDAWASPDLAEGEKANNPTLSSKKSFAIRQHHDQIQQKVETLMTHNTANEDKSKGMLDSLDKFVTNPHDYKHFACEIVLTLLLTWDSITVPLILSKFMTMEAGTFVWIQATMATIWTGDLIRSFFVGYFREGTLFMKFREVMKNYLQSWMLLDATMAALDWTIFIYQLRGEEVMGILSTLRCARLIRILKIKHIVQVIEDRINDEHFAIIFSILKLFCALLLLNHVIACIWYMLGVIRQEVGEKNWIDEVTIKPLDLPLLYMYTTSFHWSLTQFTPASIAVQPHNLWERAFAIFVLLFAMITVSTVVSGITSAAVTLRSMSSAKSKQFWVLRRYLKQCGVPTALALRIQHYWNYAWNTSHSQIEESQVAAICLLSTSLHAELRAAIYEPRLSIHPLLVLIGKIAPLTIRWLCHKAIERIRVARGDIIFSKGQTGLFMYVITIGHTLYDPDDDQSPPEQAQEGRWVAEAALWTQWVHTGTLHALTEGDLLTIESSKFVTTLQGSGECRREAGQYAKGFVQNLNRMPQHKINDLHMTPLIEGMWFRLLSEWNYKRSMHSSKRSTRGRLYDSEGPSMIGEIPLTEHPEFEKDDD